MKNYSKPLTDLITQLSKLPGIGGKSAQRLAFHILSLSDEEAYALADSVTNAKKEMKYCSVCGNLTDNDPCSICIDLKRDRSKICVVESPRDVMAIERVKEYSGLYHILHGSISPMNGIGPEDLNFKQLIIRLQESDDIEELILATNPTVEGEATAMYAAKLIKPSGIKVTRIAHGLPVGGDIEYTDDVTLSMAMDGRIEI